MRSPAPIKMWAVIIRSQKSFWIHWETIARTREQSWQKYLEMWISDHRRNLEAELQTGKVSLHRVTVQIAEPFNP